MIDLVFGSPQFEGLRTALLSFSTEAAAILLSKEVPTQWGSRLLVRQIHVISDDQLEYRTSVGIEIKPEVVAHFSGVARINDLSLTFVHTHTDDGKASFSPIDDAGERRLKHFLDIRNAGRTHLSVVIATTGVAARIIGTTDAARVFEIGRTLSAFQESALYPADRETFDRQVRAFGPDAQAILGSLKVGIVGLGGIGSVVAEQLTHLGVADLT